MGAETTLRAEGHALEGFLLALAASRSDELGSLVDALLDLLLVLELAELGADGADDDVLVLGEELEGLEAAGAGGVVLEVKGVDLEVGEELLGDDVVSTLGEVAAADELDRVSWILGKGKARPTFPRQRWTPVCISAGHLLMLSL